LQSGTADPQNPALFYGSTVKQSLPAIEQIELAGKLTLGQCRNDVAMAPVVFEYFDFSIEDNEHVHVALPTGE
jgi:hypothetical protein